ncbi:dihydropteroate synthase [Jiangella asiatica]|uniref:Dihydropteroate synthase n=1 Tax=Jiangella asiatica TaxID=2530372 RepID=A0A4V2Z2I1_9ACTN|nr:dihydropteroate synthase [Jiangella asiatica]TDE08918.1 dihydropteroate synthase [Jiangella asiatica]
MSTQRPGRPIRYVADLPQPPRALVMGVVNVTPDSFSDGGFWFEPGDAVRHGLDLIAQGADIVDVGGESTRPGAVRPSIDEERRRALPVIRELAAAGAVVSVDTMRASVAEQALEAGARLVNDVSGGQADPDMLRVVADAGVPVVLMHWRAHSDRMQQLTDYDDVVADVIGEMRPRFDAALAAGIRPEHIVFDPGLGFSKTWEHNWTLLARLHELVRLDFPVLVAASRKTFLGELLADPATGERRLPIGRDAATDALSVLAALEGAWCIRVHTVPATLDAVRVAARLGMEDG